MKNFKNTRPGNYTAQVWPQNTVDGGGWRGIEGEREQERDFPKNMSGKWKRRTRKSK